MTEQVERFEKYVKLAREGKWNEDGVPVATSAAVWAEAHLRELERAKEAERRAAITGRACGIPDQVERFEVALKQHGATEVVLASDYERALDAAEEEARVYAEAQTKAEAERDAGEEGRAERRDAAAQYRRKWRKALEAIQDERELRETNEVALENCAFERRAAEAEHDRAEKALRWILIFVQEQMSEEEGLKLVCKEGLGEA